MYIGSFPFNSNTMIEIRRQIYNQDVKLPSVVNKHLENLILNCLKKNYSERVNINELLNMEWLN